MIKTTDAVEEFETEKDIPISEENDEDSFSSSPCLDQTTNTKVRKLDIPTLRNVSRVRTRGRYFQEQTSSRG